MKKAVDLHLLINEYLEKNKTKKILFQKKGFRMFSVTGEELNINIAKTRTLLKSLGINRNDKIIIIGLNSIEYVTLFFACIFSGVVIVPMDFMSNKKLLGKIQEKVRAKAIFRDSYIQLPKIIKTIKLDDLNYIIKNLKETRKKEKLNNIIEIIHTSGSTGNPKGVIISKKNIESALISVNKIIKIPFSLKILNPLPLSHIFSQIYGLFFVFIQNHKIFIPLIYS